MHCFIKFEWDIKGKFENHCHKDSTFVLKLSNIPNYLWVVDQTWSFVDDRAVKVCIYTLEELYVENFEVMSQWALITRISEFMWAKQGINAPLETEHILSPWGPSMCNAGFHQIAAFYNPGGCC